MSLDRQPSRTLHRTRVSTRGVAGIAMRVIAAVAGVALVATGCTSSDSAGQSPHTSDAPTTAAPIEVTSANAPAIASPGCAAAPGTDAALQVEHDLTVDGTDRYYLLSTPDTSQSPETPVPVVVDLHGFMEGAAIHSQMSAFGEYGQEQGFITAFPHGTGDPVGWNTTTSPGPNPDLEYLDSMLSEIGEQRCIDTARIYATGLSYGAMMTSLLACERSMTFAAVAPVDGITLPEPCDQQRSVPILTYHGTADPILKFNGGVDISSLPGFGDADAAADTPTTTEAPVDLNGGGYPATVAAWAERNGCTPEPTDTAVGNDVVLRSYDCPPDAAVDFYIVLGGGHSWPNSEFSARLDAIIGPTTSTIDATALSWEFFQQYALT